MSVQFLSPDEDTRTVAARIASLQQGSALLYRAGGKTNQIKVPWLSDPYVRTPRFASRKEATFRSLLLQRPAFALPGAVFQDAQQFLQAWLTQLSRLPSPSDDRQQLFLGTQSELDVQVKTDETPPNSPLAI